MILGLLVSLSLVASVSAVTMTDSAMMKKDTMMTTDAMTMKKYDRMSVVALAKQMGYNWQSDRTKLAKMAGVRGYHGTAKQNLIIRSYLFKSMKMNMTTGDTIMKEDDAMMMDDKMMRKDTMMKDDSMMKKEVGMYSQYSATAVSASLASGKSVYLFFHATWCPGCRALDTAISGDLASIPVGSVIYKVDYDTNEALRQQYGVTNQHTVVKLNSDGTSMKKVTGPMSVMGIVK